MRRLGFLFGIIFLLRLERISTAVTPPPYTAMLASQGFTDWTCVFNPDLTQSVDTMIARNLSQGTSASFSYRWPYYKWGNRAWNSLLTDDLTPFPPIAED